MTKPHEPRRLGERYTIVGRLGRGGMGVVYRARDERLGRHVAVKLVPPERVGDASALARLMREARAIAALEHPGIVQVFDVGHNEEDGLYVVMELVRGVTLRARAEAGLSTEEALPILRDIASTLDTAHRHGFVHRDVKPDNVMIRDDGRVTLLDFGLVKTVELSSFDTANGLEDKSSGLTQDGAIVGSFDYIAPEQTEGEAGPPADQFALAVTAYHILTGSLPWPASTPLAAITRRLCEPPMPPTEARADLPAPVDAVLTRALAKDPTARYDSVGAFIKELEAAFDEAPSGARRAASVDRPSTAVHGAEASRRGSTRRMSVVRAAVLSLLAAVTVVVVIASLDASAPLDTGAERDAVSAPPTTEAGPDIACPILEAEGVEPPVAWLGAAASDLACRWVHWWLGGETGTTLTPAELLGVPSLPADGTVNDPFVDAGIRDKTLQAARQDAKALIDGRVKRTVAGFNVDLTLRASDRALLGKGSGEAATLHLAVHQAMAALAEAERFPARRSVPDHVEAWTGIATPEQGIALEVARGAILTSFEAASSCGVVHGASPDALVFADLVHECAHWLPTDVTLPPPTLDRTTRPRLAATAPRFARTHPDEDHLKLASELAALRQEEATVEGRAALALAEARILTALPDERGRGALVLRAAVAEAPRSWPLREALLTSSGRSGYLGVVRSAAVWTPANADVWAYFVLARQIDSPTRHRLTLRAHELAPTAPNHGAMHAKLLLATGHNEVAREIATRFAQHGRDPDDVLGSEYIAALVDMSDARFDRALGRLREALLATRTFGWFRNNDVNAVRGAWRLSKLLGRSREVADALSSHLVLSGDVQLVSENRLYIGPLIQLCMDASPDIARPCLDRIGREHSRGNVRQLDSSSAFLAGARQYIDGHDRAAVDLWRPLLEDAFHAKLLPVDAFDRAGEHQLADRLDALREESRRLHGEALSTPRIAVRAAKTGDVERARRHAKRAIDAWATADAPVPAVDEMRVLLRSLD